MLEKSYTTYSPGILPLFILQAINAWENMPWNEARIDLLINKWRIKFYIVKQIYNNNGEGECPIVASKISQHLET